jgi:hypothetical protein
MEGLFPPRPNPYPTFEQQPEDPSVPAGFDDVKPEPPEDIKPTPPKNVRPEPRPAPPENVRPVPDVDHKYDSPPPSPPPLEENDPTKIDIDPPPPKRFREHRDPRNNQPPEMDLDADPLPVYDSDRGHKRSYPDVPNFDRHPDVPNFNLDPNLLHVRDPKREALPDLNIRQGTVPVPGHNPRREAFNMFMEDSRSAQVGSQPQNIARGKIDDLLAEEEAQHADSRAKHGIAKPNNPLYDAVDQFRAALEEAEADAAEKSSARNNVTVEDIDEEEFQAEERER